MLSFKGTHFPKDFILYAVFFYVRYGVSYRDLEEIMEERGVNAPRLATEPIKLSLREDGYIR
jgi:transposase-like protein